MAGFAELKLCEDLLQRSTTKPTMHCISGKGELHVVLVLISYTHAVTNYALGHAFSIVLGCVCVGVRENEGKPTNERKPKKRKKERGLDVVFLSM